jgi:Mg-chelatase subunit ChlD
MELPDAGILGSVQASWSNVTAPSKTLMVVDVSGSMVAPVDGSAQTRLEATVAAAVQSLDVLPPASDVGLWEFSTDLPQGSNAGDYRELVPLGPLNDEVDGTDDRKTQIVDGLTALEPENDTALNDTTLAAYQAMQESFTPDVRHTIVLMTDGRNDDEGSISNDELIAQLEQLQDEERPVRVVAVAYGEETDVAQLERVAAATGGKVLASPNAGDLDELFLAALAGS